MKKVSKKMYPVIWAYNPYADSVIEPQKILRFIKSFVPMGRDVELTYVLSPKSVQWDKKASAAWLSRLKPAVQKALSGVKLQEVGHQNILVSTKVSLKHDVEHLCNYARRYHAPFIVLSTHARRGLPRFFLGSFTEAAILKSKVPLLVLNPSAALPQEVRRMLVVTDLSTESIAGLKKLIPFFKAVHAEVCVFHKMMDPIDPVLQSGVVALGGGWVGLQSFLDNDLRWRKKAMQKLTKELSGKGVPATGLVEEGVGMITDLALQTAHRENCQMIVMGTNSNAVQTYLGGSVTRLMARTTDLPLFIYPAK